VARPGPLALSLLTFLSANSLAQLDLRLPSVNEGVVASIREVRATPKPAPPAAQGPLAASPESLDQGPLVGAVAYRSFGQGSSSEGWQFGAAGTPEMQARLAQTAYEVVVLMDDGEKRSFRPRDATRFRVGQRVTLRTGELEPLGKGGA